MKKLLPIFAFCISFLAISQDIKRENVDGKIIVEGSDIEGITIYNSSSRLGTVTNKNGEFAIAVAADDLIEIRAVEYQNFDIRINEAILESKTIRIYLIEEINQLDEVLVSTKGLTGNLKTDMNSVHIFNPKLDAIYFGIKSKDALPVGDDNGGQVKNLAMQSQVQAMVNGLNVVNVVDQLLIPLFRSEVKDKKAAGVPEVPAKSIKYYLGSTFLVDNFGIPEHRVEEFIRYVEDATFDFDLLNYGHELEFLELLNSKSKMFLETKGHTD
ncbi:MAG: hypothetical protein ACJARZ_002348 [Dokdonia sp.]|jgi:hypothetical protein